MEEDWAGRSAVSHGGAREKDRYQGARWARREQKLSGKRRINRADTQQPAKHMLHKKAPPAPSWWGVWGREWHGPAARGR